MATATAPTARRRGATAAYDDEQLLELVAGVARLAAADARWPVHAPEHVSMRTFNAAKLDFDRARGLADPVGDPQRTPTANAIVMRLNDGATRAIAWAEVVSAALRGDPTMWLAATRRAAPVEPVSEPALTFALRYVANRLRKPTINRSEYRDERDAAVADDIERNGEEAMLADILPTLNHIDGQMRWAQALKLAGLRAPTPAKPPAAGRRLPRHSGANGGLPIVQAVAHYAALNLAWPLYPTLRAWARDSGFAMQARPSGGWKPVIADARALLVDAGIEPPVGDGPKPLGKGKRLSYRYPAAGIPGAPARSDNPVRQADHAELCVLALRLWLTQAYRRQRDDYARWQLGTGWPAPSRLDQHGGFAALRARARHDNAAEQHAHGTPVTDATRLRAEQLRSRLAGADRAVPFADAVRTVLAGAVETGQPPLST